MDSLPADTRSHIISKALKREDIRRCDTAPGEPTLVVPGPKTTPEKIVATLAAFGWTAEIVGARTVQVPDGQFA